MTDAKIAGLKAPAAGQIELADGIVPGLRLRMGASGIKTYILRKRVQGKWLNVTIGRHGPSFSLANARKKARDLLVNVEQGKSIARKAGTKRKGSRGVWTVAELYETYLAQQIEGKKRSAREFDRVFRKYIEPEIGDRLADSITRSDVSRFVEKIAFERGKETLTQARWNIASRAVQDRGAAQIDACLSSVQLTARTRTQDQSRPALNSAAAKAAARAVIAM